MRRYWLILLALSALTPLGLLAEGGAWGEWGPEELGQLAGFVPQGVEQVGDWWRALFPEYTVPLLGEGRAAENAGYILSALLGSALVYAVAAVYMKIFARTN